MAAIMALLAQFWLTTAQGADISLVSALRFNTVCAR